jgi:hypothetical protein
MTTKLYPNLAPEGQKVWPLESHVDAAIELLRACGTVGTASALARAAERISKEPARYQGLAGDWLRTKAIYEAVRDEHGSFPDNETPNSQMLVKVRALELLRLAKNVVDGEFEDISELTELVNELYPLYESHIVNPQLVLMAVPVDVAHDLLAFGECHCGEPIGGTSDEDYKPCLYCAARAALFSATGNEMYAAERKCFQCGLMRVFGGEFCEGCTHANKNEGPDLIY